MSDSENKKIGKGVVGCLHIVVTFPAACIWWVLFGLMLHKTNAGTAEWSLYVGYLILSVLVFVMAGVFKLIEDY